MTQIKDFYNFIFCPSKFLQILLVFCATHVVVCAYMAKDILNDIQSEFDMLKLLQMYCIL